MTTTRRSIRLPGTPALPHREDPPRGWPAWPAALARFAVVMIGAAAVGAALPPSAPAQDFELRITPRAGMVTPADWFYEEFAHFGVGDLEWTEAALEAAPLLGLTAELALFDDALWIRAEVLRTVGQDVSVTHAFLREPTGFNPPRVLRTPFLLDAALTIGSVDVALPTRFRLPLGLQPYVTAGLGGKRYDFDAGPIEQYDDQMVLPQEGVTLVVNLGAGLTAHLLGLDLDLLVRDALSEYWDKQQHDVVFLFGLTVPLLKSPDKAHFRTRN